MNVEELEFSCDQIWCTVWRKHCAARLFQLRHGKMQRTRHMRQGSVRPVQHGMIQDHSLRTESACTHTCIMKRLPPCIVVQRMFWPWNSLVKSCYSTYKRCTHNVSSHFRSMILIILDAKPSICPGYWSYVRMHKSSPTLSREGWSCDQIQIQGAVASYNQLSISRKHI